MAGTGRGGGLSNARLFVAAVRVRCGRTPVGGRNIQPEGARAVCTQLLSRFTFEIIQRRSFKLKKNILHPAKAGLNSVAEDSERDGISATWRYWTEGFGALPRMYDFWARDRRSNGGQNPRSLYRGRRQFSRYRKCLCCGRVGGNSRPHSGREAKRPDRCDQSPLQRQCFHRQAGGAESNWPLPRAYYVGSRGEPPPSPHGLYRSLSSARLGFRDSDRRDDARA